MEENKKNESPETVETAKADKVPAAPAPKESPAINEFWDFNASWITMVIYVAYLGGMIFLARYYFNSTMNPNDNYYVFLFILFLIGLAGSALLYNVFKIAVSKIAGFKVVYFRILGILFDHSGKKTRCSYDVTKFDQMELKFAPENGDTKKNPAPVFLGGLLGELLFIGAALGIYFGVKNSNSFVSGAALFAMIYGLVIPLYEFMPLRQDNPTDLFNLVMTKNMEQRTAFNIVSLNRENELSGKDFLFARFEDTSYYPIHVLYTVYLDDLYQNRLEEAVKDLKKLKKYSFRLDEGEHYLPDSESIYIHYICDDENGAEKIYMKMNGDKHSATNPSLLSDYRTAIMIEGFISSDKEMLTKTITGYKKKIQGLEKSPRVEKEEAMFEQAYKKIREKKPNLKLPENI